MSDAPERIWTTSGGDAGSWTTTQSRMAVHMPDGWQVEYVRADLVPQWQTVGDDTPKDVVLLLGWRGYRGEWETCTDNYVNTRSGSMHGQATHWMPLPAPPTEGDA